MNTYTDKHVLLAKLPFFTRAAISSLIGHPVTVGIATAAVGVFLSAIFAFYLSPSECINNSQLVENITIRDGIAFEANTPFNKQWRIRNTKTENTCDWSEEYRVVWTGGDNLAVASIPFFPIPKTAPGQERIISIPMVAPEKPGEYKSTWILQTDKGEKFGDPFEVMIVVKPPKPTLVPRWHDDFNDGQIDESKWLPPTDENLIYERDGVLNLANTQEAERTFGARLRAAQAGRPIRELSFLITLKSYQTNISGGAGLGVYLSSGRDLYVEVGPGPNGPSIDFSICRNTRCGGNYNEYYHPVGGDFPVGIPTPMRVVWTGETVEFYVNDELRVVQTEDPTPIVEFLFTMYADPGSVYHVTVGDVHVVYADQ